MMMQATRFLPTLVATLALGAGLAQAQQTGSYTELEDETMMIQPLNLSAEDVEDMEVYNAAGDEIGEVDEVLVDAANQLALAVEVGGFLDVGDKTVILPLDQVRVQEDQLVTSMTEDQLKALPPWDD
jgi:sporulation protein YlmC with PRC-barrel domain